MAFRKKAFLITALNPDILIVPECEHPDKFQNISPDFNPSTSLWFGSNSNKGLGVFSFGDIHLTASDFHNEEFKMIIPLQATTTKLQFNLFAIWANNPKDDDGAYITQVWKAVNHYEDQIVAERTILVGDFNSNKIWDTTRAHKNHSVVVELLASKGIQSVYHCHFREEQGKETRPTLFMYRHHDKPYHIDYCFATSDFIARLKSVEVGDKDFWLEFSDHVPVIATFDCSHF